MIDEALIHEKYKALAPVMDERTRRIWAATEARSAGWGGVSAVSRATGLSRSMITDGLRELSERANGVVDVAEPKRIRRRGGGRKAHTDKDPGLLKALEALVEPTTRGDPESPLRWTCKSLRNLASELTAQGRAVSHETVRELLGALGYSLQANQKTREGEDHPDRNAQFEHINARVEEAVAEEQPAISVDTKKKELIGDFKNSGREWQPKGEPEQVRTHDFIDPEKGKVVPYGVYDLAGNEGWVNVGVDHDTPEFAVASIRRWWRLMGSRRYPSAARLLITADCGGSNSYRSRLWKAELQALADETGLTIEVCHFPPGTSKWNKIEHRLFSQITQNWRGRPLVSHEVVVSLIAATTTESGLKVRARLDTRKYEKGIKVTNAEMKALNVTRNEFHGDWNYTIAPRQIGD